MEKLVNLPAPEKVFEIFRDFSGIPHGSGNTAGATKFCVNFAKEHGLNAETDEIGNVIIKKPASKGFEDHPALILQGHLDMVCEKAPGKEIDFTKEGLTLYRDGDFIFADGTTLGGDDGIAVAMILALLCEKELSHPEIEAVFTIDEETGMDGARALDTSRLFGKTMINLDSEDEDTLWVSCAGGARANAEIPVARTSSNYESAFKITLSGLCGGHSGTEIDKGRLNAVKELSRFVSSLDGTELSDIRGGLMDNAIPREAVAIVKTDRENELLKSVFDFEAELKTLSSDDSALTLTAEKIDLDAPVLTDDSKKAVLGFINEAPNGVIAMSKNIEGLVETSLNLGILKLEEEKLLASFAVRSSVNTEKDKLLKAVSDCAERFSGIASFHGEYPAWEYNETSRVRDVIAAVYEEKHGKKCEVRAIHAGLECGIFYDKIEGLDCVSFGPNIYDIHTPEERLSVSSVSRVYSLLKDVLERL